MERDLQNTTPPEGPAENTEELSRRKFLTTCLGLAGATMALTLGVPLIGYSISPALGKDKFEWIPITDVADLVTGQPVNVKYTYTKKDGWTQTQVKSLVWVVKKDENTYSVFDPRCTHLGCAYSWKEDDKSFFCPCHGGVFDLDGRVVAGPPPRPLDRYEYKVENGKLIIGKSYRVDDDLEKI
ncbi:MAG: ubiquinol-cytochrome c reductase iron-sulfur subunit [Clostridia bacterium]|nr:ubiquinol-cytochrome c reductase iron-sulfur subunit [Clostridia bacterium]